MFAVKIRDDALTFEDGVIGDLLLMLIMTIMVMIIMIIMMIITIMIMTMMILMIIMTKLMIIMMIICSHLTPASRESSSTSACSFPGFAPE